MNALNIFDRKPEVRLSRPKEFLRQRMADAVADLNRSGQLAARVELVNEALCAVTTLLFERDTDGRPANVDRKTGRLLVPAPWGEAGWRRWGLRHHEAVSLRHILHNRQQGSEEPLYYREGKIWYLNAHYYESIKIALAYLQARPITVVEWRATTGDTTKPTT